MARLRKAIDELEVEANFACKVAYLKLKSDLEKEEDVLFGDTNFEGNHEMFKLFERHVVRPTFAKHGIHSWDRFLLVGEQCPEIRRLYEEKCLFPFIGLVREYEHSASLSFSPIGKLK